MVLPEGWTDDMNVTIREDRTVLELAEAVMGRVISFRCDSESVSAIASDFGMSESDAWLAFDRVQGGVIRALTARRDNCPDRGKDPLAWHSFQIIWKTLPDRHWWSRQKMPGGPWKDWYDTHQGRRKQAAAVEESSG
jgi:hypothetical protein